MKTTNLPRRIVTFVLSAALLIALCACGRGNNSATPSTTATVSTEPVGPAGNTTGNITNFGIAAIQGDWIYYAASDGLYKINTVGNGEEKLCADLAESINIIGNTIYYQNYGSSNNYNANTVYSISTDGSDRQKVFDDEAQGIKYISVVGGKIYYCAYSLTKAGLLTKGKYTGIYVINTDGTGKQKICGDQAACLNVVGNQIYYKNKGASDQIYVINVDGTGRQDLCKERTDYSCVVDGRIYYQSITTEGRYLVTTKTDGTDRHVLCSDDVGCFNVVGNVVFYQNFSDGGKLYSINADGTNRKKLNDDLSFTICVAGDWIYYRSQQDNDVCLCRIKTDGNDRQFIQ